jgi:hypothetical protein
MNIEAQEELNRVLAMEPVALSLDEMAFLRARRSYLNSDQAAKFAAVLEDEPATEQSEAAADEQPAPRKTRKS